jgi:hypothetical protein
MSIPKWVGLMGALLAIALILSGRQSEPSTPRVERSGSLSADAFSAAFRRADLDGDASLSREEIRVVMRELGAVLNTPDGITPNVQPPAHVTQDATPASKTAMPAADAGSSASPATGAPKVTISPTWPSASPPSTARSARAASTATRELPQCSLLFFYHIVKTGGTTMRTVLQRQAQLGHFEYLYSDTMKKPRWWLILHQLTQKARFSGALGARLRRANQAVGCGRGIGASGTLGGAAGSASRHTLHPVHRSSAGAPSLSCTPSGGWGSASSPT